MSDLGIFSLLVVGRDMPHLVARSNAADFRPVDRAIPIAQQRETLTSRAKRLETDELSEPRKKLDA